MITKTTGATAIANMVIYGLNLAGQENSSDAMCGEKVGKIFGHELSANILL